MKDHKKVELGELEISDFCKDSYSYFHFNCHRQERPPEEFLVELYLHVKKMTKEVKDFIKERKAEAKKKKYVGMYLEYSSGECDHYYEYGDSYSRYNKPTIKLFAYRPFTDKEHKSVKKAKETTRLKKIQDEKLERIEDLETLAKLKEKYE